MIPRSRKLGRLLLYGILDTRKSKKDEASTEPSPPAATPPAKARPRPRLRINPPKAPPQADRNDVEAAAALIAMKARRAEPPIKHVFRAAMGVPDEESLGSPSEDSEEDQIDDHSSNAEEEEMDSSEEEDLSNGSTLGDTFTMLQMLILT